MARRETSPAHPTQCEACNAAIWFKLVTGPRGQALRMPLRAEPDPAGTVAAAPGRDWQHGRFLGAGENPDEALAEQRWRNHFDDCPHADVFRRDRRKIAADLAQDDRAHGRRTRTPPAAPAEQPSLFPGATP